MDSPNPLLFFIHIAGAAALLIWSVRLVRTGMERAFSVHLRRWLRRSADNRPMAAMTGTVAAMLLQSSTAVAILVTNFATAGTISVAVALTILLGADVGSALVAQVLLVRQGFLVPVLLLVGVGLFLRGRDRRVRQTGRILIGLALIFVSLDMIRAATEPLQHSESVLAGMRYLGRDALTAFVIGAGFAWVVQSSVAAVLLVVTLVLQGLLPTSAAVAMVLGANLGGAFIAYVLTLGASIEARRIIATNLVLRGGGAALVLAVLTATVPPLDLLGATEARQVLNLHLAFNLALALAALPFVGIATRMAAKLMPPQVDMTGGLTLSSALDPSALDTPDRALACASREVLRIGETIEAMLRSVIGLFSKWDEATAAAITANEAEVEKVHFNTKLYLSKLNQGEMTDTLARRAIELATMAVNLESAGDTIARNMLRLAQRLNTEGVAFSETGWREICDFHDRVLSNVGLALNVMMTQEPDAARELVEEKESMRALEQSLQRLHLGRLRQGLPESIETSNIHQETLRALKNVNTSFSMVAYPILSETGDLLSSRLSAVPKG